MVGWKPRDFAAQMNLYLSNGWGIVRTIVDICLRHEIAHEDDGDDKNNTDEAKFVLMKDPNKPTLRLYEVPLGDIDGDEDEQDGPAEEEEEE